MAKPKKGAFIPPFPGVRAESRIHYGGERVTEDDPVSKGGKRRVRRPKQAPDSRGQYRPT